MRLLILTGHWRLLLPVPKEDGEGHASQRETQSDYRQEVLGCVFDTVETQRTKPETLNPEPGE